MFIGEYSHNIDAKGRVIVPAKLREGLGERFIATKGLDHCLYIYTMSDWENFIKKLSLLPTTDKSVRRFVRNFTAGAIECEPDNNGRIMITPVLREYAGLTKEIVSIGALDRVEIWDKDAWNSYNDDDSFDDEELAAKLAEFGI